ncbi:DNA alkylation repair protein [Streptomyces sp. NRRL F-5123]|uniref:DNA alkylation repair protein n=1 Tax=Streptomyces sp. NRRL F-5123 TaxID=1463856 RepID=UPI0005B96D51|nr:DNA alkylation repair protein [Streptomyces sp. NRRL F-5123]
MPTADELISPDTIRGLTAVLRSTSPTASRWRTVAGSAATLGPLSLSQRARAVGEALLADTGHNYTHLAHATRATLTSDDLTGWMVWPLTEAVASAATASSSDADFDDGLDLLAQLTPRLTAEFALRTFLNADLSRTLAAAAAWTASPDAAVRRLASEGTRPKLPWARQVPELTRNPAATLSLLDRLHTDTSDTVRRSVANHLNDISRLDPDLATAQAARWASGAAPTSPALIRHAMRTLVKQGNPTALELVGFHGDRTDLTVEGPLLERTGIPLGGTVDFTARITNISDKPVTLAIDYVVHHLKANGKQTPKVFKLAKRALSPGETTELGRSHAFRTISTRRYYPGTHAIQLQVNGHPYDKVSFNLVFAE